MAVQVNVLEAKTQLSRLLDRAEAGEEVIIARAGQPVARLVPVTASADASRMLGTLAGKGWIADDFGAPVTEDFLLAPGADAPRTRKKSSAKKRARRARTR
ncbi:MAG: type II toxin-antitoxin system Phd/YefM family antitoxin [Deltaproteobacteria bacterium]|nr:type II toxin-antitoxin system Phd/YefM family antitoxin [Deltaproteobacteria bacterium]